MRMFRIGRNNLYRLWTWTCLTAAILFLILVLLDRGLSGQTSIGVFDLQNLSTAAQYQTAHNIWIRADVAMRVGFALGLDYLFMPLYAVALFCSGLVVQDCYMPKAALVRRVLAVATLVPLFGALLDALENALELYLLMPNHGSDMLAELAFRLSNAKMACFYVGLALLLAALFGLRMRRMQKKLARRNDGLS